MTHVKSSRHSVAFSNIGKIEGLRVFIAEYRRCLGVFVNHLWENGYEWEDSKKISHKFLPRLKMLETPSMISSSIIKDCELQTSLTGRALKCCMTQAAGLVKGACEKQRKRLYGLEKLKSQGVTKSNLKALIKNIKDNIPRKPFTGNASPELNSICCDYQIKKGEFNGFLKLKSITKDKLEIAIPIKHSRHSLKLASKGELKKSFLISEKFIYFRWEIPVTALKLNGKILGADQGYKDILTLSDGTVTTKTDSHGHSLESVIEKVSRKKKGSKAFAKAKVHQKNFVNWSINQLNFLNVKEVKMEEIFNINFGRKTSRKLSHWQNTLIRDKVESKCMEDGVRFTLQSCAYKSQRCNACGNVRKANRKGKVYSCKNCGTVCDADLNAAKNHEQILPDIPYALRKMRLNLGAGFFWDSSGFSTIDGGILQYPLNQE